MDHPAWKEIFESLNPEANLPCSQTVKEAYLNYASFLTKKNLEEMANTICGIAVDGTTFRKNIITLQF